MDCGQFVKIGVSCNVENRRKQIPYSVKQYYCTESFAQAFKAEKIIHNALKRCRAKNAKGREYFNICFNEACEYVKFLLAIHFGINRQEIFINIFRELSKEDKNMSIAYMSALRDKEIANKGRQLEEVVTA